MNWKISCLVLNSFYVIEFFLCVVIDDSNARATKWWRNEMIVIKGAKIDLRTNSYNFMQIIFDTTLILPNAFSCIDFIL